MPKTIKERIQEIDDKILSLSEVYQSDIGASYKEASQTQDIISMLERQKFELKAQLGKENQPAKEFKLKSADGEIISFKVVQANPDRQNGEISIDSSVGQELMKSPKKAEIFLNNKKYKIVDEK